jgi:hypothetical protein
MAALCVGLSVPPQKRKGIRDSELRVIDGIPKNLSLQVESSLSC